MFEPSATMTIFGQFYYIWFLSLLQTSLHPLIITNNNRHLNIGRTYAAQSALE